MIRISNIHMHLFLNGCVGLIRTWLSCPVKESPDQVAQMTYRFIEDTAQGYLNMQK